MTEHRTYIPNNRTSSSPETMTRLQQDLSSSPHQENYLEENGVESPMLRRTVGRIPHVCVVGAGVAGLRCADVLLQHGVKVTILEGRDRVGGRLCQSDALGHKVDLGPNWIHGTDNNPILDLAQGTDTATMTWDGRQSIFDHLGNAIPPAEAAENTETVWTIIEQAMHYSNEESASIPANRSLYNFFEEKVQEMFPAEIEGDEEAKQKRETVLQMAEMWGAFVGSPIQKQSLKFFWMEECIDGENLFVAGTYCKVLDKIAEPALKGADVRFGCKVSGIATGGTDKEPNVQVEVEGKERMSFDEVIVTAPLGWLKTNMEAFVPELPSRLKQAVASIGYGHLDKVYITFPTAFWNTATSSTPNPASTNIAHDHTIPNVTATTAPLHQPSKPDVNPLHYPGFTHWTKPTYATPTNPSHWPQEAMNLAALPDSNAHPTLLFYTYGPTSLHLASLLSSFPIPTPCSPTLNTTAFTLLTSFFTPYFSRLPNFNPSDPSHQPVRMLATAWANDELAGYGSYSNFQVGLERGGEDVEVMRRGVPERGIWLAGEHTAPFVALGTVTGAWWAGEGVARRICRAYGIGIEGGREGNASEGIDGDGSRNGVVANGSG